MDDQGAMNEGETEKFYQDSHPSPARERLARERLLDTIKKERSGVLDTKPMQTDLICHFCKRPIDENVWYTCNTHKNRKTGIKNTFCKDCATQRGDFYRGTFAKCNEQNIDKKDCCWEKFIDGVNQSEKYRIKNGK